MERFPSKNHLQVVVGIDLLSDLLVFRILKGTKQLSTCEDSNISKLCSVSKTM